MQSQHTIENVQLSLHSLKPKSPALLRLPTESVKLTDREREILSGEVEKKTKWLEFLTNLASDSIFLTLNFAEPYSDRDACEAAECFFNELTRILKGRNWSRTKSGLVGFVVAERHRINSPLNKKPHFDAAVTKSKRPSLSPFIDKLHFHAAISRTSLNADLDVVEKAAIKASLKLTDAKKRRMCASNDVLVKSTWLADGLAGYLTKQQATGLWNGYDNIALLTESQGLEQFPFMTGHSRLR